MPDRTCQYQQKDSRLWLGQFEAMKSPCEIWLETDDEAEAKALIQWAADETWRIEKKYSRFRDDSVLSHINQNAGSWQTLDDETRSLLHFADDCWRLTEGMIDITIGAYLKHWCFDGETPPPPRKQLKQVARNVGWEKVQLQQNKLLLPEGMQLDLGGIGKEYAVDTVALALSS
jgi:thiamine biosynthesis lipoprotein